MLIFIYGLCIMFYGMMAWLFLCKGDKLSKLVAVLMCTICLGYTKDLFFINNNLHDETFYRSLMTCMDMIAVPMYAFILMELLKPGMTTKRLMTAHIALFALPASVFIVTESMLFYYLLVALCAVYGITIMVWTIFTIAKYNRRLMNGFSYAENINLHRLRIILFSFSFVLVLWILDCVSTESEFDYIYIVGSLAVWIVLGFFLYKHKSVTYELKEGKKPVAEEFIYSGILPDVPNLNDRITSLFYEQKIFLNPNLKISDVATKTGSNRTYVSNFFNREIGTTFFDYVNGLRVEYSCRLLESTDMSIKDIAKESGFNSHQTFIRVFARKSGVTPAAYREKFHSS